MCVSECCGCCVALIIGAFATMITGIICLYKFCAKKEDHCHEINRMKTQNLLRRKQE